MDPLLFRSWSSLALRGLVLIAFGVVACFVPAASLLTLALFFAVYTLLSLFVGVGVGVAERAEETSGWWMPVLNGAFAILGGLTAAYLGDMDQLMLVAALGVSLLVMGAFDIVAALRLARVLRPEPLLTLAGIVALAAGVLLLAADAFSFAPSRLTVGVYALLAGALLLGAGLHLRSAGRHPPTPFIVCPDPPPPGAWPPGG